MKSQNSALWEVMADDLAIRCCTSATLDSRRVKARVEHEGISFLTISLPKYGSDFQKGLDRGFLAHDLFQGFSWKGGLPKFLSGFLELVFNRDSGVLLDDPSIDAIFSVRQLTLSFGKMLLPCSKEREEAAMDSFIECEKEIRVHSSKMPDLGDFHRMTRMLYARIYNEVDSNVYNGELLPKHGPGATADKLRGNAKFRQSTWTSRLEEYFPFGEYVLPNWRYFDQLTGVDFLEPGDEVPVKVTPVPKTLKTPRIIAIEPTAMQYAQQAVLADLLKGVVGDPILYHLIGFDDQAPNQRLAREGSQDGDLATLDLSEASDRVSNQLVRKMLVDHPHLHGAVDACRSRKADVPGHGVIRLAKFASMGSALCFPFEAMVFLTIILLGIEKDLGHHLSRRDLKGLIGKVRVYGDDLIIPVAHVHSVIMELEAFGFRVNHGKSFWNGKFRESCGKDYYHGEDVSVVRFRKEFPVSLRDADSIVSLISFRNQLYLVGMWRTCAWLDEKISRMIKYYPVVSPTSRVEGRHSFLGYETQKVSATLHTPLVKGYVQQSKIPINRLDDHGALTKCLLTLESRDSKTSALPSGGEDHLERSGRPVAVNIKLRWAQPF